MRSHTNKCMAGVIRRRDFYQNCRNEGFGRGFSTSPSWVEKDCVEGKNGVQVLQVEVVHRDEIECAWLVQR